MPASSEPGSVRISSGYGEPRVFAPGEAISIFVGTGKSVERWTVSDPEVASVEPDGYLHKLVGKRAGTVTVVAVGADFEASETFHVADLAQVKSVEIVIDEKGHELNAFRLRVFAVHDHFYKRDATEEPGVEWSSSDELVARFDPTSPGTLRGVGEGGVRVSVALGGCTHARDVHVQSGALSAIGLPFRSGEIVVGVSKRLDVGRQSTDRGWCWADPDAIFTASPADMVEITTFNGRSVAKGLRAGRVTIHVHWASLRSQSDVDVSQRALRLRPLRNHSSGLLPDLVFVGEAIEVSAGMEEGSIDDEDLNFVWSSAPEGVLELDVRGSYVVAKGVGVGKAKITVRLVANGDAQELALQIAEQPEVSGY